MKLHSIRLWTVLAAALAAILWAGSPLRAADVATPTPGAADASAGAKPILHVFHYVPAADATVTAVDVAGDFNGWSTTATPMTKAGDGSFYATVPLSPGNHSYKFVADGNWMNDPSADKSLEQDDQHGGKNSGVNISPQGPDLHTFTFTPPAGKPANSVGLAGDFNGWSTTATPMDRKSDGTFSITLDLSPGVYHYKFIVDGNWMPDPAGDKSLESDDGFGGKNSGIKVGDASAATTKPDAAH